jgi:microcystin-dependent protein
MTQVFGDSIFNEDVRFFGPTSFIGYLATVDDLLVNNSITANSFIKSGGTSNAFLKADGSLDTATYVTAATVGGAVDNTGGQLVLRSGTGGFSAGIVTTTSLTVNGNARITGIVSTSSVTDLSGGYLSTPPGTVITVAASTAPTGYLKANGASLNTTTYASLFSTIGYTFGGSGASFTLPDLRGEFIRGWDDARTVDTGRTFGSSQVEMINQHRHWVSAAAIDDRNFTGSGGNTQDLGLVSDAGGYSATDPNSGAGRFTRNDPGFGVNNETRPRNIALLYCIKY